MSATVNWTCPSCGQSTRTPFCATCGEEPVAPRELTLRGLAEKLAHALTSVDARVLRTAWRLVRSPGALTLSWTQGARRAYVAPFQLFLLANVLFFALQSLTGMNVFSSTLESHLHRQDWSELAQSLTTARLAERGMALAAYEPLFDRAVVLYAKSLIVLMAAAFALLLPLVNFRQRRPFMVHVVFALHLYAFLLLLFCLALAAGWLSRLLGGGGLDAPIVDNVLSIINLGACGVYLFLAIKPVYGTDGVARPAQAIVLALAVAALVLGYRFLLFLITLHAV